MPRVAPLGLRLFLEGVEVPIISAQVTILPSQPVSSAIQIVPTSSALNFLPRTMVHLFSLDPNTTDKDSQEYFKQLEENRKNNVRELNRVEASDTRYKLVFCGEVIGLQHVKTSASRQMVLQCMDLSIYWDTCYQWYADYSVGGSAFTDRAHNFVGAGSGLFDNITKGHRTVISDLLNSKPRSPEYKHVGGLLGGIIHVLEAVGGVRPRSSQGFKGYSGVNEFFTIAELRYNLLGMVGAVEGDTTSSKMYAAKSFSHWLKNGMSSMGNLISFRDIIRQVGQYVFHDLYPNPAPYFAYKGTKQVENQTTVYTDAASGKAADTAILKAHRGLAAAYDLFDAAWAATDVVPAGVGSGFFGDVTSSLASFAGGASSFDTGSEFAQAGEELRKAIKELGAASATLAGAETDDIKKLQRDMREATAYANSAFKKFKAAKGSAKGSFRHILNDIGGRDSGGVPGASRAAAGFSGGALRILEKIRKDTRTGRNRRNKKTKVDQGSHLYSQLLLPETFFVAPPRCNVLFPDQITSFQYSRNFMREVTRLSCKGGVGLIAKGRGAKLLSRSYFAPAVRDASGRSSYATLGAGHRVLLPHEIHSGIIPKFEWVTGGHRWASEAAKKTGKKDEFFQVGKVGYVQRLAHFQYFLHRWSSRTMSVRCVYNPNLVIGLPGVVIDRAFSPDIFNQGAVVKLEPSQYPVQYIGKLHSITHNINQTGGFTSVNYTHCRTHRGVDDEFLGVLMREKHAAVKTTFPRKGIFPKSMAENVRLGGRYRNHFIWVLQLYLAGELKPGIKPSARGKVSGKVSKVVVSSSTVTLTAAEAKTLQLSQEGSYKEVTLPKNIRVTYTAWRGTGEWVRSKMAVEDALRPGWYSDVWSKEKISEKVYQPLLGTRAITDDKSLVTDPALEGLSKAYEPQDGRYKKGAERHDFDATGDLLVQSENLYKGSRAASFEVPVDTLENAIDSIALLYSVIQQRGLNVHEFVREFTSRPIANLVQVLGSSNLRFHSQTGKVRDPDTMTEGFHSRAYGDYNVGAKLGDDGKMVAGSNALGALDVDANNPPPPVVPRGSRLIKIPGHLDPRGRARARVNEYRAELLKSRGLVNS